MVSLVVCENPIFQGTLLLPFYLHLPLGPVQGEDRRGSVAAEGSCAAAAAQLSGGRKGHSLSPASRCNADGSQGYVCTATPAELKH